MRQVISGFRHMENSGSDEFDTVAHWMSNNPNHFYVRDSTSCDVTAPHIHDVTQIWWVTQGSLHNRFEGKDFVQSKGDILIVPPYFKHQIDTRESENVRFIYCEYGDAFVNPQMSDHSETLFNLIYLKPILANAMLMNPFLTLNTATAQKVEEILYELLKEYAQMSKFSQTILRSKLIGLLNLVVENYEATVPQDEDLLFARYRSSIQLALEYLDSHFMENIALSDISKIALMSNNSFSYIFKQITGKTFVEYLNYLRIYRAQRLLIETDQKLTEICFQCGFRDSAYFSTTFKKYVGCSPSVYRNIARK